MPDPIDYLIVGGGVASGHAVFEIRKHDKSGTILVVDEEDQFPYEGWKSVKDYGKRWMVEVVFAAFKRVLGDTLMSRSFLSQKAEATLKVILYNRFMSS